MSEDDKPVAVNATSGIKTEDGRLLFGLDAETYLKIKAKEDPEYEKKVGIWIEKVIGEDLLDRSDLYTSLKNGIILCKLVNVLRPNMIPKINTKEFRGQLHVLSERENITLYLEACWKLGLAAADIFVVSDLHGRQGMAAVLNNITALSQIAATFGCKVAPIGPKKVDLAQKKPPKFELNYQTSAIFVGDIEDDDVEELEEELRLITLKLEESTRTIKQLEVSKQNLNDQIQLERSRNVEAEKEAKLLRSSHGSGGDEKFIEDLKLQREKLFAEIEDLLRRVNTDPEVLKIKEEIEQVKEKLVQKAIKQQEGIQEGNQEDLEAKAAAELELSKRKEDLIKQIEILKETLQALQSKVQTIKNELLAEKNLLAETLKSAQLEMEKLKGPNEEIEKKKTKIQSYTSDALKIDEEFQKKNIKLESEYQLAQQTIKQDIANLKQRTEETEKQRADNTLIYAQIQKDLEEEIRNFKSESNKELSKLQSSINHILTEKTILQEEQNVMKERFVESLNICKSQFSGDIEKYKEKIHHEENELKNITQQLNNDQNVFEEELNSIYSQISQISNDFEEDSEKIRKEKRMLDEELFSQLQKKERELFEKENILKREYDTLRLQSEQRSSSFLPGSSEEASHLNNELEQLKREKVLFEEQIAKEREQILTTNNEQQINLNRSIQAEKLKRELLERKWKSKKGKLEQEIQKEIAKRNEEIQKITSEHSVIENEKNQINETSKKEIHDVETEITNEKAKNARANMQLQNAISELITENNNMNEDREKLRQNLQEQMQALKVFYENDTKKLDDKFNVLSSENETLRNKVKESQAVRDNANNTQLKQSTILAEELNQMKTVFNSSLDQISKANNEIIQDKINLEKEIEVISKLLQNLHKQGELETIELEGRLNTNRELKDTYEKELNSGYLRIPAAVSQKIKELETKFLMLDTNSKQTISNLKKKLEESNDTEFKDRIEELKKEIESQKVTINKLTEEISQLSTKKAPNQPHPTQNPVPSSQTMRQLHRRTTRVAPIDPPPTIDQDLETLRLTVLKIMSGESVLESQLLLLSRVFKFDQGRRVFTFLLKEYAESPEDSSPLLLTSSSFDQLKTLIDLVLDAIDLRNGGDYINGKILLETASLIGREGKGGPPEFIQESIKSHKCWQNTFFWKEYFWAQTTVKFSEFFGESSVTEEKENEFWESEVVAFAKIMYNWGDIPFSRLVLFAESLADSTGLGLASTNKITKILQEFHLKEQQRHRMGHRKSRMFVMNPNPTIKEKEATSSRVRMLGKSTTEKEKDKTKPSTNTNTNRNWSKPPRSSNLTIGKPKDAIPEDGPQDLPQIPAQLLGSVPAHLQQTLLNRRITARSIIVNDEVKDFIQGMLRRPN